MSDTDDDKLVISKLIEVLRVLVIQPKEGIMEEASLIVLALTMFIEAMLYIYHRVELSNELA